MNEEEVLVGRIQDLAEQCYHRDVPSHTEFLTLAEQDLFYRTVNRIPGVRYVLSGGYEAAERKAALFLPSYAEALNSYNHPFTAPMAMPSTSCLWNIINIITGGMIVIVMTAPSTPKFQLSPFNSVKATAMGMALS